MPPKQNAGVLLNRSDTKKVSKGLVKSETNLSHKTQHVWMRHAVTVGNCAKTSHCSSLSLTETSSLTKRSWCCCLKPKEGFCQARVLREVVNYFNCWFQWMVPVPSTKIVTLMDYDLKRQYIFTYACGVWKILGRKSTLAAQLKKGPSTLPCFSRGPTKKPMWQLKQVMWWEWRLQKNGKAFCWRLGSPETPCKYCLSWKRPVQHCQLCKHSGIRHC